MKILAKVSWNPKVEFEEADLIDIVLSFKNGESREFKGQLKKSCSVIDYLNAIVFRASNQETFKINSPVTDSDGKRDYEILISSKADLEEVLHYSERIQKSRYIVDRDEWITDEEYCKFFGSSNGIWNLENCDYSEGNFVETLRQVAYDMEQGSHHIWKWANVPKVDLLRLENDPEYAKFIESIRDFSESIYKAEGENNTSDIIRLYREVADFAEKYMQEKGIDDI